MLVMQRINLHNVETIPGIAFRGVSKNDIINLAMVNYGSYENKLFLLALYSGITVRMPPHLNTSKGYVR